MLKVMEGRWTGLEGLALVELEAMKPAAEARVREAVVHGQNELKKTLTGARSGRTYTVSRTGRAHVASAPGEPPAVLFGNLRNSVGHSRPRWTGWTVEAEFGVGLGQPPAGGDPDPARSYARRLELGGTDSRGVMIQPRPYMEPTALRIEPQVETILRGAAK